jgi:hypothetical protein
MARNLETTELRSEEMQEVISSTPGRLTRWGSAFFFIVIGSVLIGAALIKYPDKITSPVAIAVIPKANGADSIVGTMKIQQEKLENVKEGQPVFLRLTSYPAEKYGFVNATVVHFNDFSVSADNSFTIHLAIPNPVVTSKNKTILLKPGMIATGEIRIRNEALIRKIFPF